MTSIPRAIGRVLDRLRVRGDVKTRGKGWRCLCPAHDDNCPSLDVDIGHEGRVLLCCRSQSCSAAAIAKALGLSFRDLFDGAPPEKLSFDERILHLYDYKDELGKLLFQTVRLWERPPKNKDFRQRRPDGKNGWIWNLQGVRLFSIRLSPHRRTGGVRGIQGIADRIRRQIRVWTTCRDHSLKLPPVRNCPAGDRV